MEDWIDLTELMWIIDITCVKKNILLWRMCKRIYDKDNGVRDIMTCKSIDKGIAYMTYEYFILSFEHVM